MSDVSSSHHHESIDKKSHKSELNLSSNTLINTLCVIFSTVVIYIAAALFPVIAILLGSYVFRQDFDPEFLTEDSIIAQFLYVSAIGVLVIGGVVTALKLLNVRLAAVGLGRKPELKDLIKALIGFAIFFSVIIVVNIILSSIFPELNDQRQDVGFKNINTSLEWALAFAALVIVPPISEEILVRGYLYSGLRSKLPFIVSAIITSVIFGLVHLQNGEGSAILWAAGINTFILSLILVYLREKTAALYAGILIHALNNLVAFGVYTR